MSEHEIVNHFSNQVVVYTINVYHKHVHSSTNVTNGAAITIDTCFFLLSHWIWPMAWIRSFSVVNFSKLEVFLNFLNFFFEVQQRISINTEVIMEFIDVNERSVFQKNEPIPHFYTAIFSSLKHLLNVSIPFDLIRNGMVNYRKSFSMLWQYQQNCPVCWKLW